MGEEEKNMGVRAWESKLMLTAMNRFLSTVTRYVVRNKPKRRPRRRKCAAPGWLYDSMLLTSLLGKHR